MIRFSHDHQAAGVCTIMAIGIVDLLGIVAGTIARETVTARMFEAINGMLLDMLAAITRKDYEDRRRRQMQGQARAKAQGKYVGRPENKRRNNRIAAMLAAGASYSDVQEATGCSAKIAKRRQKAA